MVKRAALSLITTAVEATAGFIQVESVAVTVAAPD